MQNSRVNNITWSHPTSAPARLRATVSPSNVLDTFLFCLALRHEVELTSTVVERRAWRPVVMMMVWTRLHSTGAMVFSDAESQSTNNDVFPDESKDIDNIVEHTTQEPARALSRALFAQMTETVHLQRRAQCHPTSDLDTPPRVLEFSFEALSSPNLNEIMFDAGQVELPNIVTR